MTLCLLLFESINDSIITVVVDATRELLLQRLGDHLHAVVEQRRGCAEMRRDLMMCICR